MTESDPGDAVRKIIQDERTKNLKEQDAIARRLAELKEKHDLAKQTVLELCEGFGFKDIILKATEAWIDSYKETYGVKDIKFAVYCNPRDFENTYDYKMNSKLHFYTHYDLRHLDNLVCTYGVSLEKPEFSAGNGEVQQAQGHAGFEFDQKNLRARDWSDFDVPISSLTREKLIEITAQRIAKLHMTISTVRSSDSGGMWGHGNSFRQGG